MNDVLTQVPQLELHPGSVSWLVMEPDAGYGCGEMPVDQAEPITGRAKEDRYYPSRNDLLWKAILEDLPEGFLQFFFPATAARMDPEEKVEYLDQELLQLFPPEEDEFVPRRVDKLMKVVLRDRSEGPVILHCEVQGYRQADFSPRMFRYYCRIWDKYPQQVKSIAILTDGDPSFRPEPYREVGELGDNDQLCYRYKIYKVLDQPEEELERSDNPFALVILTTKTALKARNGEYTEEDLFRRKLELLRWLEEKKLPEAKQNALLSFLTYYLPFKNKKLEKAFKKQLIERRNTMGIVEFLVNDARETGEKEGLERGLEQGLEQGLEKGRTEKELAFVQTLIKDTDFDDRKVASLTAVEESIVKEVRTALTSC